MDPIFHLVAADAWPPPGDPYRPSSLAAEGFVHFSFRVQVAGSAQRHYGAADALVAVEVDPARLGVPVVVEDSYGSGTGFPHGYGPVPLRAVVAVHAMTRDGAGRWTFEPDGPDGPAKPDGPGRTGGVTPGAASAPASPDR